MRVGAKRHGESTRKTEVSELQRATLWIDEDVLRLQITANKRTAEITKAQTTALARELSRNVLESGLKSGAPVKDAVRMAPGQPVEHLVRE